MSEVKALLDTIRGEDQEKGWAAVQALLASQPSNEEERKAKAYACACMAESLFAKEKIGSAIDWWQECVFLDPLNPTYRLAFVARGLLPAAMHRQAYNEASRALNLDKKNPEAWRMLGHCELALHDTKLAIRSFDKVIELDPENPGSYLDRVDLALELADWETVEQLTRISLGILGEHRGNVLHQLGLLAMRKGDLERALKLWDETMAAGCDNPEILIWNQSVCLLALGKYRDGWKKHESRGQQRREIAMAIQMHRGMPDKLWDNQGAIKQDGNTLRPTRLHVHQEQGYGDAIAMARYLPLLKERGYDVRFEVMESLVDLMRDSFPDITIVPRAPIFPGLLGVPEFDYHVPCLSLPRLFGTEVPTIPWRGPYLKANPDKVAEYRAKLRGQPAIGLCWSAGVRIGQGLWINEYGKRKSMHYDDIAPLIDVIGCQVVSLQVGPEREQQKPSIYGATYSIQDLLPENPSWADTAALIECLDLVITVDTGLAHLVGGMGKPMWLLMHTEGSWHWMVERPGVSWNDTSPWYPNTKLFRQKKPHEWEQVIERVKRELDGRRLHQLSEKCA